LITFEIEVIKLFAMKEKLSIILQIEKASIIASLIILTFLLI